MASFLTSQLEPESKSFKEPTMKQLLKTLGIILFCLNLCIDSIFAQADDHHTAQKTQVVIVGTIHSAHYKNPNYNPDILKEIILYLKPDAILNELPLSQVDPNGRPLFRDPLKNPEGWAADTVAQQLDIKQIPFDRPDRQENFKRANYFERQKRANELRKKWSERIQKNEPNSLNTKIAQLQGYAGQAEANLFLNAEPDIINSEAHDSIIRIKKSLWYEIVPEILKKYPEYKNLIEADHFFQDQWIKRNKIMADNIVKAAKRYPGKRLIVIIGATHRYILRDLLKDNPHIELKEYWELIEQNIEKSQKSPENKSTKQQGIVAFYDGFVTRIFGCTTLPLKNCFARGQELFVDIIRVENLGRTAAIK